MGATYAVPFPVIVRSIFGMYGVSHLAPGLTLVYMLTTHQSYPIICIRSFVALMWTAILVSWLCRYSTFLQLINVDRPRRSVLTAHD